MRAGVAVLSIRLATTVPHVPGQERWGGGDSRLRVLPLACRREAGGRVTTNVMLRDLDLPVPDAADSRRLEVVVDGLPLFGGSQRSTQRWCVLSMVTEQQTQTAQ